MNLQKRRHYRGFVIVKSVLIAALMGGVILLVISSCATGPKGPLTAGELRLVGIELPERENIKTKLPFVVNINFEADGRPEIRTACFYFSGDGPYCFKVTGVQYGSPGTMKVQIHVKNPGPTLLEGYVVYIQGGKVEPTNLISTYFRVPE
jgi:hypothetical protein